MGFFHQTLAAACLSLSVCGQGDEAWPWQTFRSFDLGPPSLRVSRSGAPTSPGYLFFDQNGPDAHNYSLFIMSEENELIWQSPRYGGYSAYSPQVFRGKQVLAFNNGVSFGEPYGFGYGIIQILDNTYTSIYNVTLVKDDGNFRSFGGFNESLLYSWIDMHEATITPHDTMLVTMYNVTQMDLTTVGGSMNSWITDSLFYEIDIETDQILFQWSAKDHVDEIPLSDVTKFYPLDHYGQNQTLPWGYFHVNSVDKFNDGSYLISSRYYCAVFKVGRDGSVEWTFQGETGGDFELDPEISFHYQHDARIIEEWEDGLTISVFNNDNALYNPLGNAGKAKSNTFVIDLDTTTRKATLRQKFIDPEDPIHALSQGNSQLLSDGHLIVNHGSTPKIKEFAPDGTCIMTVQFGPGDNHIYSYRGHKAPWAGLPAAPPSAFACRTGRRISVYMSWNGATEIKEWLIFAGDSQDGMTFAHKVKKSGFETFGQILSNARLVRAEARGDGITPGITEIVEVASTC